jgi:translation initiation factor IF-3
LIGEDGEQLGVVDIATAQQAAIDANLDLVKIAPTAKPPVCKIMDYGKYKFEIAKREKENRKNQKVMEVKEVRLSPSIDTHDFETKLNSAIKFLKSGSKVKVAVRFRGREINHSAIGTELLQRFADAASEYGSVDKNAKLEGRSMVMFMAPKA